MAHSPTAPAVFEHESALAPVTALSFIRASAAQTLLLAGEGPFLTVYEHGEYGSTASTAARILLRQRIFRSQAVHGIAVQETGHSYPPRVLLWGGYCVRVIEILLHSYNGRTGLTPCLEIVSLGQELDAADWILDASFSLPPCDAPEDSHVSAVLVTAHNSLHLLSLSSDRLQGDLQRQLLGAISSNSRSILYSAHVIWDSDSSILIAAGTVFGEILVWSCHLDELHVSTTKSKTLVHCVLTGHEGSIFGVQISPLLDLGRHRPQRLLASCSDDRTVRIWDISELDTEPHADTSTDTGFSANGILPQSSTRSQNLIAVGWGHSSRVWGVRFLGHHAQQTDVLSFGEDATCRQWSLKHESETTPSTARVKQSLNLTRTHNLHSGKHIWSTAILTEDTCLSVTTGGADGKIASVSLPLCADGTIINQQFEREWRLEDIETFIRPRKSDRAASGDDATRAPPDQLHTYNADSQANINGACSDKLPKSKPTRNATKLGHDSFKDYAFVSPTEFLTSTTQGRVFLCSIDPPRGSTGRGAHNLLMDNSTCPVRWKMLVDLDLLKSYPVISSDPASGTAFLSGPCGVVYLYDHRSGELESLFRIDGKISGLFSTSSSFPRALVTCAGSRKAYLGVFKTGWQRSRRTGFGKLPDESLASLELPEAFVVTSAGFSDAQDLLLLGSRSGALAAYGASGGADNCDVGLVPLACLRRVHGFDAVTAITPLPGYSGSATNKLRGYILTAGRNGTYAIHQASKGSSGNQGLAITTVHISTLPLGPMVEGAYLDPLTGGLILYGFRSKNFIAWNESKECEIVNVECGGAHRNWSFSPSPTGSGGGIFVWTKSSRLHVHTQLGDSHRVVKRGSHGREIKASAISPPLRLSERVTRQLFATGSEDTVIRIFELEQSESDSSAMFESLCTFKKHATGIQHLQWTECGRYLISSGGMEELFVWKVRWIPGFGVSSYCEGICPVGTNSPDLRIVSFATTSIGSPPKADEQTPDVTEFVITMVYSDSTIKAYRYSSQNKTFQLVLTGKYSTCCLTHIFQQRINNEIYILTAGTDGYLVLWRAPHQVPPTGGGKTPERTGNTGNIKPTNWHWRSRAHQSSVKSMIVIQTTTESLLAITGGDDNAIVLTHIKFNDESGISSSVTRIPKAHASAITALAKIPNTHPRQILFTSSSNDQRLKLWSVLLRKEGFDVMEEGSVGTAVADVSGIVVGGRGGAVKIVVSGVGMEAWRVSGRAMERAGDGVAA
ncbi:MAG: hypothetical protein M1839_002230 [Geoglossum umbratile]|nr:MAG: hypothetical protein M1839_002230 [Geoglossum umbratile]